MSHPLANQGCLTDLLGKGLLLSVVLVSPSVFVHLTKTLTGTKRDPGCLHILSALPLHTLCAHAHFHHLTQMFFSPFHTPLFFFFFFFSPTSPFQATQNGCKHRLPAGRVECLRGLHSLWSSLTDSPPCV